LNALRRWAFNFLKAEGSLRGSFSGKQFKCLLDDAFLDKIIASALCSLVQYTMPPLRLPLAKRPALMIK
jgi:hypothetical protein